MTQKSLIIKYIEKYGSITPAKVGGTVFEREFFGSETSKRCREMRKEGVLDSKPNGKFETYFIKSKVVLPLAFEEKKKEESKLL